MFNLAIELRLLSGDSPNKRVKLPKYGQKELEKIEKGEDYGKSRELFEPDQVRTLLHYLWERDKSEAAVYALLFFLGLRVSLIAPPKEKKALKEYITIDMIDLENKEIILPGRIMKAKNDLNIDEDVAMPNLWPGSATNRL